MTRQVGTSNGLNNDAEIMTYNKNLSDIVIEEGIQNISDK